MIPFCSGVRSNPKLILPWRSIYSQRSRRILRIHPLHDRQLAPRIAMLQAKLTSVDPKSNNMEILISWATPRGKLEKPYQQGLLTYLHLYAYSR